jgi:hypothetical protein
MARQKSAPAIQEDIPQGFVLVVKKPTSRGYDQPIATLGKEGQVHLNSAAVQLLGDTRYVQVFYNPDAEQILIRPTAPSSSAYTIHVPQTKSMGMLTVKRLCRMYGIKADHSRKFAFNKTAGGFAFNLREEIDPNRIGLTPAAEPMPAKRSRNTRGQYVKQAAAA